MKYPLFLAAFAAASVFGATVTVPLKSGWKFIKADDPKIGTNYSYQAMSAVLDRADRGDLSGAPATDWSAPAFDDSTWTQVRVPHDWGVMKGFDPDLPYGDGFLDVTGIGWYRLAFNVSVPKDGVVYFECDGAMSYSHVWVNGHFVGGWPYGYTRFRLDVTRHLRPGDNVLAVRCHNVKDSSRWYTGGGLYRNCRLLVCPKDHVVPGSVAITTPEVTAKSATVRVRYAMSVSGTRERVFTVANPRLWDIDDPHLYTVDVEGNEYRYGIRTIAFHSDERRFQLNGRTVPLNGVSMHHDFGVLGAAWNRSAQRRRLLKFKEAGVNAIRSSHNPPDEGLLELCDELGLLVKDEVFDEWRYMGNAGKRENGYHNIFDTWHARDVRAWVRTDRNHPCVIMWSLGNEICDGHEKFAPHAEFVARARELSNIVTDEDATRPTTNANNNPANYTNDFPSVLAIMGCNYFAWQYPRLKKAFPDVPFYGSETICMSSTRGEYSFPVVRRSRKQSEFDGFYMTSYCWESCGWNNIKGGWACPPDAQWYWMDQVKTCMGEFIWTGIDYLGGPYWCDDFRKKPRFADPVLQARALEDVKRFGKARATIHTCNTGFLDQAGFRKDAFYLFQSRWLPNLPMAHILPHWNWQERAGEVVSVYVFTSGDEAELFLNGRTLGRRRKEPGVWDRAYRLCWDEVRYEPGTLEAVAYRNGKEWARDVVRTTGEVAELRLEPETRALASDGEDICFVNVSVRDAKGDVVPRTRNRVAFRVEGPAELVAVDNGDETNMEDFHGSETYIFNGWAQAIVRAKPGEKGTVRITATSSGLPMAETTLSVAP